MSAEALMTGWLVRTAAVLGLAGLAACSDDPTGTVRVDRVEVGPADQVLVVGDSTTITAVPLTAGGDVVVGVVLWRSLSPAVATLEVSGGTASVKAKSPGIARIEAESGGRMGFVNVTVVSAPQVASVTLQPTTLVLEMAQEAAIQAVARTAAGAVIAGRAVTWTVTGTGVTITPAATPGWATVTAHTTGTAVVRATIDGVVGEAEVQVVTTAPPPAQVATVTITPSGFSLPENHETPLEAIARDASGAIVAGRPVTWTSTSSAVATITPIGVSSFATLLAKSAGTTVIRATVDGITAEMTFQVTAAPPPPSEIFHLFFSPNYRGIWTNQLLDFSAHLVALGATGSVADPAVTWAVDDPTIAVVDESGNVRGLTAGTTKVRATAGSLEAVAEVTVFQPVAGTVVYDLTFDWRDSQWHMAPQVGTETWTDASGVDHEVALWPVDGTLTMTPDGSYERTLVLKGWATVNGTHTVVIEREVVDSGVYGIMVGGESGYWMHSATTPDHVYAIVAAYNAGDVIMRAEVGTAPMLEYLFRMRQ
jgi:trimeric autotransporter adhesin